jgi:protein-S-isoprenylcysteine O-methyltransferase Ste14
LNLKKRIVPIIFILLGFLGIFFSNYLKNTSLFEIPTGVGIAFLSISLIFLSVGLVLLLRPLSSKPEVQSRELCWFCEKRSADINSYYVVKMHKPTRKETTELLPVFSASTIYFESEDVKIPRCRRCAKNQEHEKVAKVLFVIAVPVFIGGAFLLREIYHTRGWLTVLIFGILILIPLIGYGWIYAKLTKDYGQKSPREHSKVKNLELQGYKHGEQPN